MRRALFLDRDGTVIEDRGYMRFAADVHPLPDALEVLSRLQCQGWMLITVSNQSGVGSGLISMPEMEAVQNRFIETLSAAGVTVTESCFCLHSKTDLCDCRKPSPKLVTEAAARHGVDLTASFMLGDRDTDIFCGKNAGCATIWLRNHMYYVSENLPDYIASDWLEIERLISGAR